MAKKVNREKYENIAVAIDKDKGSQYGLKWAVDNILGRNQSLTLVHVKQKSGSIPTPLGSHDVVDENGQTRRYDAQTNELFLPYRCFCKRKEIKCNEVVVEETDIVKGLIDYVNTNGVDALVFGSASRGGFMRFKSADIPGSVSKVAPDFCTVYTILKGKLSSVRKATAPAPVKSVPKAQPLQNKPVNVVPEVMELPYKPNSNPQVTPFAVTERTTPYSSYSCPEETDFRSPFTRGKGGSLAKSFESSLTEADISFVSSGRPSTDRMFPSFYEGSESGMTPRLSNSSDYDYRSFGSLPSVNNSVDMSSQQDFSSTSIDSGRMSWSQQKVDDVEAEMSRLRLELKQTMDMYSSACKEALTAKQKARELHFWKMEEQQKLEDARSAEEAALALVEKEKAKCKAAIEAAQAAQKIAELEAQKRMNAEFRALRESEEKKAALQSLNRGADLRYRRYAIEEIEAATHDFSNSLKIGEGGYGPVYKAYLDHTPVAIKVLRPDAAQGRSQFQQEVEVLSCIRHPNMVLLLGACPEFGCLVYEYMANGSLDDRLCRRGNTPPLSWQLRFKIAAEIGTGLLFLHQTKPEALVHRDLKPGNILLDRNFVSKISDVGLARLVPPSIVDSVTQYRMTSTAGTFCYIDPEYQQTGMLGTKSDIYSLGIMFLQIITSRPPMGLTHQVERSIEKGTFREMLDPAVPDWPVEEAMSFAKLALKCAELRKKDRPDLGKVILPELDRLRALAEDNMSRHSSPGSSPNHSFAPFLQEVMSDQPSGFDSSSRSRSSTSSST